MEIRPKTTLVSLAAVVCCRHATLPPENVVLRDDSKQRQRTTSTKETGEVQYDVYGKRQNGENETFAVCLKLSVQ